MKEKKLGIGIIEVALNKVLKIIIPFLCAPYITRRLGLSNVGIYSFTNSIVTYFCIFASLGTYSYGKRTIARNRDNLQERSRLFWEIEIVSLFTTIVSLLAWGILIIFSSEYSRYYYVLSFSIIAVGFDITWFLEGIEKYRDLMFANIVAKTLGVLAIFLFIKKPEDLYKYFIIVVITELLSNLFSWVNVKRYITNFQIESKNLIVHFKETLFYFIPTVAISLYTVLDKSLLGFLSKDTYASGCYEQVTNIINIIKGFSFSAITTSFGIRASYLFGKSKNEEVKLLIVNALNMILFLSLGSFFGIIGVAKDFIFIFLGEDNTEIVWMLCLLTPVILVVGISDCLGGLYYTPIGKRKKSTKYIISGAVINVFLDVILIPLLSAKGAIIASVFSESVIMILYLVNCDKYLNLKILFQLFWKKCMAGICMAVTLLLLPNIYPIIINLILKIIIGVVIYIFCLITLRDDFLVGQLSKRMKGDIY